MVWTYACIFAVSKPVRLSDWLILGNYNGYKPYHHDMVDTRILFILDYISLSYIYKVLKPLPVQWMDIWMYPYWIKTREVG